MFAYVVGAVVGAVLMGRTKAKMPIRTLECFGPRTGITWTAEVLPGNDVFAVHAPADDPARTIALFHRQPDGRFKLLRPLQGAGDIIHLMQRDFEE